MPARPINATVCPAYCLAPCAKFAHQAHQDVHSLGKGEVAVFESRGGLYQTKPEACMNEAAAHTDEAEEWYRLTPKGVIAVTILRYMPTFEELSEVSEAVLIALEEHGFTIVRTTPVRP